MKKLLFSILFIAALGISTSFAQTSNSNSIPPISELPKDGEVKTFHELDASYAYELFDKSGKRLREATGKFVDTTDLKPGMYFIRYNGVTEKIIKEGPKN